MVDEEEDLGWKRAMEGEEATRERRRYDPHAH
jgi:hypothetical protein